jgi:hypothetical protein
LVFVKGNKKKPITIYKEKLTKKENKMSYEGIFIRDYVGETPESDGNSWTNSPDIFCSRTSPISDISSLTNQDNYDKGLPNYNEQTPLQYNYVYVRGKNYKNGPQTSTIYLYYVDTSIVLWPQNWKTLGIMNGTEERNWIQVATDRMNGLVVGNPPFLWQPPRESIHYCLVAWVKNGDDQGTPPNLYSIGSVPDMANFILTHPNVGWKNTIEVDGTQPTIENTSPIIGSQQSGKLNIGVQLDNLPDDGYIEFSVAGPDKENTIEYKKTSIGHAHSGITVEVTWPANFNSSLVFKYWKGATEPPAGANIIPIVGTWGTGLEHVNMVRSIAPSRVATVTHFDSPTDLKKCKNVRAVPPKTMLLAGSIPYKVKI